MIEYTVLRSLILALLSEQGSGVYNDSFVEAICERARERDVFPSELECQEGGGNYSLYREGRFNPSDVLNVYQIIWDLSVERIITPGSNTSNPNWPWFRLTDFGKQVVSGSHHYYDPEGYAEHLQSIVPELDDVVRQYALEGTRCFKQRLWFAAAVMLGAAAERLVLLLLESIRDAESDPQQKQECTNLLDKPRLPAIFSLIKDRLDSLEATIPYNVHQGSITHLNSLFEMIRVHRNEAVHPKIAEISQQKIFLALQSFPGAIEVMCRLIDWFKENEI